VRFLILLDRSFGLRFNSWFGLILLPLVSFSADGFVCAMFFAQYMIRHLLGKPKPPAALAKARSIDLSIQFLLFWLPVLILLGWITNRPVHVLFGQ
jgi:Ca2+:H+ antiporter